MRVALDAMGGDFAPGPIVAGACEAVADLSDLTVVLVGDRDRIEAELAKSPATPRDRMPIVHAGQAIGMDEKPVEALRKKRDNSISRCWGMMAAGEVEAVVSAGNTGAMVASALFNAKDVPTRRPTPRHRRDLPLASGADRDHRRRREHERQGGRPLPVRRDGGDLRRGDPGRDKSPDRAAQRRHGRREGDRADPHGTRSMPSGEPLGDPVRRECRRSRHL